MTNGHWKSVSSVGRTISGLGVAEASLLTGVFVSSDSRVLKLKSASG